MELTAFWITLFLLGATHALEPGHGKLLVTSYLTSTKSGLQDVFLLGILVAVVHTISVAVLGLIIVFLAFSFFQETFTQALQVLSGVIILSLGLLLFWRRFIQEPASKEEHCDCHLLHTPTPETELHLTGTSKSTLKEVIMLGLASGITPCPVALTALVAAFSIGKPLDAVIGLSVFSAGIGTVLIVLGIMIVKGIGSINFSWAPLKEAPRWIARLSTCIVLLLGAYLIVKPFLLPENPNHQEEGFMLILPADKPAGQGKNH